MTKKALVLVSALAFSSVAHADVILDTFSVLQGTVVTAAAGAPQSTVSGNRTIRIATSSPSPLANPFANISAVSSGGANGSFQINNPSLTTSLVELIYTLSPITGFAPGAAGALTFDVLSNDNGNTGNTTVSVMFTGVSGNFSIAAASIPAAPPGVPFLLGLTGAQMNAITGGGTLKFSFTGPNDYDLTLDNIGLVPEPASITLMGLGIFGLGMARRRKAA
jgi:PEP-CTERM motif